jgi:hypothetical protein
LLKQRSGHLWILKAFGIFLLSLVAWMIMAIWTGSTFGVDISFASDLNSRLKANYSADEFDSNLQFLSFSILGEVMSDSGLKGDSGEFLEKFFQNPVPTATAESTQAHLDSTATVTSSFTPDLTGTATSRITGTPTPIPTGTWTTTSTPTRTRTVTATAIVTSTSMSFPSPSSQPTKTPTVTTTPIPDVFPILECVEYSGGGSYIAYFGYENPNPYSVQIPIGCNNYFSPAPTNRGQPTTFSPGRTSPYPNAAFSVSFEYGNEIVWHLLSHSVKASYGSESCNPGPTMTPTGTQAVDTEPPTVSVGSIQPTPGPLGVCEVEVYVDDVHVVDPPYSSGIEVVKLKYRVKDHTGDIFSDPLTKDSGGLTIEHGWDGYYSGSVHIRIEEEWPASGTTSFWADLWVKAKDNAGHEGYTYLGYYTMPYTCGSTE